jgi:flagellar hook-associated protein 3 FlgL
MIDTSTNANEQPFRDLMRAATMMSQLGNAQLPAETQRVVAQKATVILGAALSALSNVQATLGVSEQRIADSNERMSLQKDMIGNRIGLLEGVNDAEAITRVNELETQIEMSYAITGKIQKLNILDYL